MARRKHTFIWTLCEGEGGYNGWHCYNQYGHEVFIYWRFDDAIRAIVHMLEQQG